MARWRVRANVSGGAGGSRWQPRADQKDDARFTRRVEDREAIEEGLDATEVCEYVAPHGVRCGHPRARHGRVYMFGTPVCFDRCDGSVAWHTFTPADEPPTANSGDA